MRKRHSVGWLGLLLVPLLLFSGCGSVPESGSAEPELAGENAPSGLAAVERNGDEPLRVVATTNILADIVAQVSGDKIELVELVPTGADPHSFEPRPQDLIELNRAHVIFVNGLGLEEGLEPILDSLDGGGVTLSVNDGVEPLAMADHDDVDDHAAEDDHGDEDDHATAHDEEGHNHEAGDPHTWFSVDAVKQWVVNIEQALSTLDPENQATYAANAAAYRAELDALDAELAAMVAPLPVERRKLITDHESFGYLADAYGFEVVGTIIPSLSTLASPSAAQLAALLDQVEEEGVPALFVGTTVSPNLAEQLANDAGITVVTLYTGSLSDESGPAASYLELMRHNMGVITDALQ